MASAETDWFVDSTAAAGAATDENSLTDWLGSDWQDIAQDEKAVSEPDYDPFAEVEPPDRLEEPDSTDQISDAFVAPVPDWLSDEADDLVESEFTVATDMRGDMPDWLTESAESDFDVVQLDADSVSDWLEDVGDLGSGEAETGDETAVSEKIDSATDWLADLSDKEQTVGEEDWLAEMTMSDDGFATEDEGWLSALSGDADSPFDSNPADSAGPAEEAALQIEDAQEEMLISDDGLTEADDDWLAALSAVADETIADTGGLVEEASSDDWLAIESEDDAEIISDDWLASLAGDTQEAVSGETIGDTADLDEPSDDWLAALAGDDSELVPDEPEQVLPADELDLADGDDWLANLESPTDFLNELNGLEAAEMSSQDDDKEKEQKELPKSEPEPSTKELMDWLDELDTAADEPAAEPVEQPQITTEEALKPDTAELPDWLSDTAEAAEETAVSDPADLPDWLQKSEDLLEEQALSEFDVTSVFEDEQEKEIPEPPTALLDELQADLTQDDQVSAAGDDVSWLSELPDTDALGDTSTFDWLDAVEETESVLDWMDNLDADFDDEADDVEDEPEALELDEPEIPELFEEPTADIPSDLDDAMSWLEDLAAEESAPVEPLPTVAEVLDEGLSQDELDSDLDFLELTLAGPDEVEAEDVSPISEPDQEDALDFLSDVLAESAEEPVEALPEELDTLGFLETALLESTDEPDAYPVEQDEDAVEDDTLSDLDDAMAWLDEMADSPDMLAEADDLWDEQDEVIEESDTFMDVLAEAGLPTDKGAEFTMDEAEAEIPEDLDEAMAWLETLAAKQGAPMEELPSLQIQEQETEPAPDDLVEYQIESDAAFEPLVEPAFDLEAETAGDDMLESIADVPEDLDDAMAWLEELAARQGAPIEELPTMAASDSEPTLFESEDDDRIADVEDAAVSAIEPLADEMPVPQPPTELDPELASALDWLEELVEDGAEEEVETAVIMQTSDDDLAEALDWLEQIALGKPAAAAEPPTDAAGSVDETETATDEDAIAADWFDMPEDPDAALAWLEEMSDEQPPVSDAAPVTEVIAPEMAVTQPQIHAATDTIETVDEETADGLENLFDGDLFDFPEDPDAALAWLEEVSTDDLPVLTEAPITEVIEEPETAVSPETIDDEPPSVPEADLEADLLSSVPEDPDEAMAWLEQLAARQGASLDELPSVSEQPEDEVATPDWIAEASAQAELAAAEDEAAAVSSEPVAEQQPDVSFDEDDLLADLDISDIEAAAAESVDDVLEEDVTDDMPGWWSDDKQDDDDKAALDHRSWLRELPDSDVTGWLEAEAAASSASTREDTASLLPETGPLFESASMELPPVESVPLIEEEMPLLSETDELASSAFHIDEDRLESARSSLTAGEMVEALSIYQELVSRGDGLMMLINELETAVSAYPQQLEIHRLLGDAYMRNGQLQKALVTYRQALDRL